MFHAPTAESKQQNDAARSQSMPERTRELSPRVPATMGPACSGASAGAPAPGRGHGRHPLARLHSAYGNQAILRMLSHTPPTIQAKLTVNQPGDQYEQEADRVADRIMRMSGDSIARGEAHSPQPTALGIQRITQNCRNQVQREEVIEDPLPEEQPGMVQTQRQSAGPSSVPSRLESQLHSLKGGGQPLPQSARGFFEPRFGYDFGAVRIHTNGPAAEMARTMNALAFTLGPNIVFGAGQYSSESASGKRLLAHELTHVVQQGGSSEAVMRAGICSCPSVGRDPTPAETTDANSKYPNLKNGDWCVTGEATGDYNCIAWTIGVTNRWVWDEVDAAGDNDGTVSVSDFDAFYGARGLRPATAEPTNAQVALFANNTGPTHAAKVSSLSCGSTTMFESKRGRNVRILHVITELEGGLYGNVVKFYVNK